MNRPPRLAPLCLLLAAGCGEVGPPGATAPPAASTAPKPGPKPTLAEARRGFATALVRKEASREPIPAPPPGVLRTVRFRSPAGDLAAYLSSPPGDGKTHPAIVWIFGGFDNSIGETAWEVGSPENDQSARAFREAGVLMMYPALRGGNDHPGPREGLFGEVDDVLAAADYLARQDGVDPARIYLGGHSTGGTLALLAAEMSGRFRAVFALGPVDDVAGYGPDSLPFNLSDRREVDLRSPVKWLDAIRAPTFVFEGGQRPGNMDALLTLSNSSPNPEVHYYLVKGANHFSVIAPLTRRIASKVVADSGPKSNIAFTQDELDRLMGR